MLDRLGLSPSAARVAGLTVRQDGVRRSAFELLSYREISPQDLQTVWPELATIDKSSMDQLHIDACYAVYLERQWADVEAVRRDERREIPAGLNYASLPGLSAELREKLSKQQPATIAQAQKIEGMTPAAILIVLSALRKKTERRLAG